MQAETDVHSSQTEMPPGPVAQNIDTVAEMHLRIEQQVSREQRRVEAVTAFVGRPRFISMVVLFVALWTLTNLFARRIGAAEYDAPPFYWLQGILSISALFTSIIVLTTQNRQAKILEQRDHLELQTILLTEQKATKIIALIEELRRDMPNVSNRPDAEAEALAEALDPNVVATALEVKLNHVMEEAAELETSVVETREEVHVTKSEDKKGAPQ